jgi:hypothetical protein
LRSFSVLHGPVLHVLAVTVASGAIFGDCAFEEKLNKAAHNKNVKAVSLIKFFIIIFFSYYSSTKYNCLKQKNSVKIYLSADRKKAGTQGFIHTIKLPITP